MQTYCQNRKHLKIWRIKQLILEGKTISKVIHILLITKLNNKAIDLLHKIQKNFIWQWKKAKNEDSTLCNGYEKDGIKNC